MTCSPRAHPSISLALLALLGLSVVVGSCTEEFDPRTLVNDLRVLAIRAEPSDLTEGEATALNALVAAPGFEDEVQYQWEWCPITEGPDQAYTCVTEGFGVDEALFDLGTGRTAVLPYFAEAEQLQQLCLLLQEDLDFLPDFVEVPDCDLGVDVYVRLTIWVADPEGGEPIEKVAIKRVYLWFDAEPEPLMRNATPVIDGIFTAGAELDDDFVLRVAPGADIPFFAEVDPSAKESFLRRDLDDTEVRTEEILFSWFSTDGEWDRDLSFSDETEFTLREAGRNTLFLDNDLAIGDTIDVFFVVRDGRGGQSWQRRQLLVVDPSGSWTPDEDSGTGSSGESGGDDS